MVFALFMLVSGEIFECRTKTVTMDIRSTDQTMKFGPLTGKIRKIMDHGQDQTTLDW